MELEQTLTVLDNFAKEWIGNIKKLEMFRVAIVDRWDNNAIYDDLEYAEDFPILKIERKRLEIEIINEKKERLSLYTFFDNDKGVNISFSSLSCHYKFDFWGDISIFRSVIKLMHRFPETITKYHRQYRLLALKEAGLI